MAGLNTVFGYGRAWWIPLLIAGPEGGASGSNSCSIVGICVESRDQSTQNYRLDIDHFKNEWWKKCAK